MNSVSTETANFRVWLIDQHAIVRDALAEAQSSLDTAAIELAVSIATAHRSSGVFPTSGTSARGNYEAHTKEVQFLTHLETLLSGVVFSLKQGAVFPFEPTGQLHLLWQWFQAETEDGEAQ